MKLSTGFVVMDTESTGPNPDRDRIIQIGCARFADLKLVDSIGRLVNPGVKWERDAFVIYGQDGVGVEIPQGAFEVHGIAACDLNDAFRFPEVFDLFNFAPVMVTFNGLWFDIPIAEREAKFAGITIEFPPHVDIYPFVAWHLRGLRSRKLSAVANFFGIRADAGTALHTADVDCVITGRLLAHMIGAGIIPDDVDEAIARQRVLGQALDDESARFLYWFYEDRENGALRMGCGRYTGKLIADVPKKEWHRLLGQVKDAPDHIMAMIKEFAA